MLLGEAPNCGSDQLAMSNSPNPGEMPQGQDIPLTVVYEDKDLIVIDKPAGLVVHPAAGNWSGTLLNALLHHAPALAGIPRAGIVHRLDKDTSGLLVVAKTLEAQTDLVRQLQARTVKREYQALARGLVERGGTVDAPIGRHPTQRIKMAVIMGSQSFKRASCIGPVALVNRKPLERDLALERTAERG